MTHSASLRLVAGFAVALLAAACAGGLDGGDTATELTFNGTRYTGVVIPDLRIERSELASLGFPEESDLGRDRPVLELPGVDAADVVVVEGQPGSDEPWVLFVRYGLIGAGRGLFEAVPALCRYAPTASECTS